jgi:hypothetical protein
VRMSSGSRGKRRSERVEGGGENRGILKAVAPENTRPSRYFKMVSAFGNESRAPLLDLK